MVGALVISSCMDHLLAADTAGFCAVVLTGSCLSLATGFQQTDVRSAVSLPCVIKTW